MVVIVINQLNNKDDDPYCINTIPDNLIGQTSDAPIAIPDSFWLPYMVLVCIYHRYVTTIQTPCTQPKLMGRPDKNIGYVCVDDNFLEAGKCRVVIFDPDIDQSYIAQIQNQYSCDVDLQNGTYLQYSFSKWISNPMAVEKEINLLVLKLDTSIDDVNAILTLFRKHSIIFRKTKQISLKIFLNPTYAWSVDYKRLLQMFKEFHNLGYRIFFYDRDINCIPSSSETHLLSCYSVYMVKPHRKEHAMITMPAESVIQGMTSQETLRLYDTYLSSLQITCQQNIRIGHVQDGGWNVCHDVEYRPQSPCMIYSFGISGQLEFW